MDDLQDFYGTVMGAAPSPAAAPAFVPNPAPSAPFIPPAPPPVTEDDAWQFRSEDEQQFAEAILQKLVDEVQKGLDAEICISGLNVPEYVKQKLRRRLPFAIQERRSALARQAEQSAQFAAAMPAPMTKTAEQSAKTASRGLSMRAIAGAISRQALEKIQAVFAKRPDLARQVREQGLVLARNGVTPDLQFRQGQVISVPTIGVEQEKDRQQVR
jgi:hypothetical protein